MREKNITELHRIAAFNYGGEAKPLLIFSGLFNDVFFMKKSYRKIGSEWIIILGWIYITAMHLKYLQLIERLQRFGKYVIATSAMNS